jgi:hypothetical protein
LLNAWKPAVIDALELLLVDAADEVEVEGVEDPAAIGRTEAIATVLDVGVVEVVIDAEVVEVLDAVAEVVDELVDAVDDVVNGTAGVGGASKRRSRGQHSHFHFRLQGITAACRLRAKTSRISSVRSPEHDHPPILDSKARSAAKTIVEGRFNQCADCYEDADDAICHTGCLAAFWHALST